MAVVMGLLFYRNVRDEERQILDINTTTVTTVTKVVKNGLMAIMLEGRGADFKRFITTLIADEIYAIRLFRQDGTLICSSIPSDKTAVLENKSSQWPLQPEVSYRDEGGHLIYTMRLPIFNERPCHGCHVGDGEMMSIVEVEVIKDKVYERLKSVKEKALVSYIAMILVFSAVMWVGTNLLVAKPLRGMISTAKRVKEGDLTTSFHTSRKDELGDLGRSINSMLSELNRTRHELEHCHVDAMQKVEKMATIGELAAAIAHEIKNPLAGISGAIQVFAEDFPQTDPRKDIINEVLREIERLDKAVRDLLNFAKPPEPYRIKTQIIPVVERAERLFSAQAKKQGVSINIVALGELKDLYIDPEQMQQVFLNIMINALHSMPGGGTITVSAYSKTDNEVEIIMSDTGEGIPHEALKNIFKPFFTTKHTGTGLGLAISKNIVEKHGGRITVDSQVGVGSNFRIILPVGAVEVEDV